jgi:hypothetical protein
VDPEEAAREKIDELLTAAGWVVQDRPAGEDRRDCYRLYVVTPCSGEPQLQEPIKDPARFLWHEVTKVQHYWLEVNARTEPLKVREGAQDYGGEH